MPLSNSQYNQIMRDYDAQQLLDRQIEVQRTEELYRKLPQLKEIDQKIADVSLEVAMEMIESGHSERLDQEVDRRVRLLVDEKQALMKANGFPEDFLQIPYRCPDCKDTGYIQGKKCHCFRQAEINLVYHQSHLTKMLESGSFDDFNIDYYSAATKDGSDRISPREAAANGLAVAKRFVSQFGKGQDDNLLIYGETGMGKTFLANCIARALLDQGYPVIYFTAFQFFDLVEKHTFSHDSDDHSDEDYENLLNCDLLILDDIGTELSNNFTRSQLFAILNERLIRKHPTILTTNLSLADLKERYDERIFSRALGNYTLIKLFGDDIRLQRKFNNTPAT